MCAIDYCDEFATVWLKSHPRARKPWTCCECGRTIQPGEKCLLVESLFEGRWSKDRTCLHCEAAASWLGYVCGGYVQHGLHEELREHWDEGYTSILLGRLLLGMRDRWHAGADPIPDRQRVRDVAHWSMERKAGREIPRLERAS